MLPIEDTGYAGVDGCQPDRRVRRDVRRLGEPWTFGLHPGAVAGFVARSGLRLCEDLGADDYRRRYLGAAQPGYGFYRIALAEVPHAAAAG